MDFITDLVKESGITNIIFDMKKQIEDVEYLNKVSRNSKITDLLDEYNNYQEQIEEIHTYIENINELFRDIENDIEHFQLIFDLEMEELIEVEDFNIHLLLRLLNERINYINDECWYLENHQKNDLENYILCDNKDITNFNIDCDSLTVFIEYKEQDYEIEL